MSTSQWQQRYSTAFVLIIVIASLVTMVNSLKSGFAGFEDNFQGRRLLIASFNRLRYILGDRVFPQVLLGEEGWMEYTFNGNLDDYQNVPIDPGQLEKIHLRLDTLHKELAARNITLIVVIAPNKSTIYPEKVPGNIEKLNAKSRLDIFLEITKQTNSAYLLDLRPAFFEVSQRNQLYYKTDTHWSSLGAFIAYREIMNTVAQSYPDLQPYTLDQFTWKETDPQVLDLSRLMGVDFIVEPRIILQPEFDSNALFQRVPPISNVSMSWANNDQQKTLLMYHDSFGVMLQAFLQHHFEQAMYIQNSSDTQLSNLSWIDTLRPDVVIIEIVERNLTGLDTILSSKQ